MHTGIVKFYNVEKGFGFIKPAPVPPNGNVKDVFVHRSGIVPEGARILEGDKVSYEVLSKSKGPCAANVQII